MKQPSNLIAAVLCLCLIAADTQAKVPTNEAALLGSDKFTPMGAIRAANSSGDIPRWTGTLEQHSSSFKSKAPYADEAPLFIISADNYLDYSERLSAGQIALFKKYPKTFRMPIYPSHRDGGYSKTVYQRTRFNAENTELVNGVDGLRNFTGGAPFPFPKNGAETLWNARVIASHPTIVGLIDDVTTYPNGTQKKRSWQMTSEYPYAFYDNPVGKVDEAIGINAGYIHSNFKHPPRKKGEMVMVHEPLDAVTYKRKAWIYIPGTRRVRRAPTVGYDTPDGPGGLITVDDNVGFNGAMNRYDWSLVGQKEVYIPYHNYKFDTPNVDYKELLPPYHANPDYMRYELHRVWVVEANLKKGSRHVYAKRRWYIDEDSWLIHLLENYDGRGELWRVGMLNSIYEFDVKGYIVRAQVFHDLQASAYIGIRLFNNSDKPDYNAEPRGEKYYSPHNLRKLGKK